MTYIDKIEELERQVKKLKKAICCAVEAGTPSDANTPSRPEGAILYDNSFLYINTAAGWKKVALASV